MAQLRFDGRVAIVTGAGRGMGRSHALTLAARGASVVVNDIGASLGGEGIDAGPARDVVEEIRAAGGLALANVDSVSTTEGAHSMVGGALANFGRVDIIVNNAGIATSGAFTDLGLDDFMKHLSVHLVGAFNVSQAAWPHMLQQDYGRIVMITSSAFLGHRDVITYAAAKSGMIGLAKSLALAGAEGGIKVNAIAPAAYTRMGGDVNNPNITTLETGETRPVAPENASAGVVVLAHESCPVNGEVFGVGAGHIGRLFIADTIGYTRGDLLDPDDAIEHWDEVMSEAEYYVPLDCTHHSDRLRNPRLLHTTG